MKVYIIYLALLISTTTLTPIIEGVGQSPNNALLLRKRLAGKN